MLRVETVFERTALEPRPYQRRIVTKANNMFNGEHKNGAGNLVPAARSILIESPTGSGKTPMGLVTVKAMQERHGGRWGWVAMRRNLLAQAHLENESKKIGADIVTISMFDKEPPTDLVGLVIDEAQHDAASSMGHLHNVIQPKWILGLSATPFRQDRMKLCFDYVIKDAGIHQLIADGFLSPYDHYTIPKWDVEELAGHYLREPDRWGKSIFFFHQLHSCYALQEKLSAAGVRAEVVTGDSDRERQLEDFHNNQYSVLINCAVLTEGFDCPDLKTVWSRDSGKGPTVQMCGRVFRLHAGTPLKQIVQSKNTHWPFMKTAMPVQSWLLECGEWRSLKVNPKIDLVTRNSLVMMAQTTPVMPAFITANLAKNRGGRRGRRTNSLGNRVGGFHGNMGRSI